MIRDTITMARKEWLEIIDQFIHFKRGGWSVIVVIIFLGIFVPLQLGPGWANLSLMFFYWPFLTASMTSTIVSDAVAGERERHTLETLLSTRLPDTSILLGKLLAAVLYGYAFALTNLLIGYITVKIRYGPLAETMSLSRFAALFVLIGAASSCIAGVGVSVSLRAATVRQAQQTFGIVLLVLMMTPLVAVQFVSEGSRQQVAIRAAQYGVEGIAWRASVVLLVLAVTLLTVAVRRFKRGELVLE
jgi:ABC-2 type transport system permease protein